MTNEPDQPQIHISMQLPDDMTAGKYANLLAVWHTPYDFTLDFAIAGRVGPAEDGSPPTITAPVVARIKIPTGVIFNIAKAIADNVSTYEQTFGPITTQPDNTPIFPPEGDDS